MGSMMLSAVLAAAQEPQLTNGIGKLLLALHESMGVSFGVTVIVFTVLLRVILSPLDIWQRIAMRKQTMKMQALRPKLEKLQRQYANRPDILRQKQYELQRGSGMNMLASCLPMIITLVVFWVVFAGFRSLIAYQNEMIIYQLDHIYAQNYPLVQAGQMTMDELNNLLAQSYNPDSFLWIKNVHMSDIGTNVIPSIQNFLSTGVGGLGADLPDGLSASYETLVGPAMQLYNKQSFWDAGRWNGYFVLPVLAIGTSILSTLLTQKLQPQPVAADPTQEKTQKMTMKMMTFLMPVMLGVFAIMYSAAFAIYYVVGNVLMTIMSLSFTLITRHLDKKNAAQAQI